MPSGSVEAEALKRTLVPGSAGFGDLVNEARGGWLGVIATDWNCGLDPPVGNGEPVTPVRPPLAAIS